MQHRGFDWHLHIVIVLSPTKKGWNRPGGRTLHGDAVRIDCNGKLLGIACPLPH